MQSFTSDLKKFTRAHSKLRCYGLGLGLDNFRVIALTENFRKLDVNVLLAAYNRCSAASCPDALQRKEQQQQHEPGPTAQFRGDIVLPSHLSGPQTS